MTNPVPVRIVGPVAGIDPAAQDGDALAYEGATGLWRSDSTTRTELADLDSRVDALEAGGSAGGALKAHGTTGLLSTTFGLMDTSGPWTLCPVDYRVTVPAAVGDVVQWIPDLIIYRGEDSAHDLASVVGGAPARYASSQTAVQSPNGHAAMYLGGAGSFASSWPVMVWQVQAADLEDGNLTLALMYRAGGSGNRVGSTNPAAYPNNQIAVLNWGPATPPGDDLTGRVIALEEAVGAANGIATLDATTKVPIAQLPTGTTAGTVAAGDDARLSDARTPLPHTHAQADVTGLTDALAGKEPAGTAATALQAHVDAVDPHPQYLTGTEGNAAYADKVHTHAQADVTGLTADLAARQLTSEKDQNNGYAGLSASGRISGTQQTYATLTSSILPVGDTASVGTLDSAARSDHVHPGVNLTADQTVGGVKTFTASPIVPTPSTATQAANKSYADTKLASTDRGVANGVASLDAGTKVPIAQIPTGTTGTTVAVGDDARFTDARTPTAHAASHASGGSDPVTPAAIGALATTARGAANGVASLDSATLVPIAQLPVGTTAGTVAAGNAAPDVAAAVEPRLQRLEHNPIREDRDLFGDLLSSIPRYEVTQTVQLVNGTIYATRMSSRIAMLTNALRMAVAVAGAGGTCAIALYEGATTTSLVQQRVGTISLTAAGRVTHTMSSTYTTTTGGAILVAILPLAYTTAPQLGGRTGVVHSTLLNPAATLATSITKTGQSALPATIDMSDGTWNITGTHLLWTALG